MKLLVSIATTLLVLLSTTNSDSMFCNALSATSISSGSGSSSSSSTNSVWAPSSWKFTLNIGRERGTLMPEEWGASGNRLVFPLTLRVTSDRPTTEKSNNGGFRLPWGGGDDNTNDSATTASATTKTVVVGGDPYMLKQNIFTFEFENNASSKYITMQGEKQATFAPGGGWKIRLPTGKAQGRAARFMCYMDLDCDIEKNDVVLRKGERIYLTAKCWREEELERAYRIMKPIARNYAEKQQQLERVLDHYSGDRRLDGTDVLETLMGMKDTAQLVLERDAAKEKYEEAKRVYPACLTTTTTTTTTTNTGSGDNNNNELPTTTTSVEDLPIEEGPWPGQIEWLAIEPLYAMVRREKLFVGEEYHIIGTWEATPVFTEEEEEEYDEPSIF